MKKNILILTAILSAVLTSARADVNIDAPSYSVTGYFTHTSSDTIVSFDWDNSGNLYYETATPDFDFGGFYQSIGGSTPLTLAPASSDFAGDSVVHLGNYIYFNSSTFTAQNIYKYGPIGVTPSVSLASTTANFGLYAHAGSLFITGAADFGTNHIYYSQINGAGNLASDPATDLGITSGSSGPLAFDAAGNLYYAPGFSDLSIYRWTAAQVAAAIADPTSNPLTVTGHLWLDYSALYGTTSGATSMLLDSQGNLLLTLTSFSDPSLLVDLGVDSSGAYNGDHTTILDDTNRLGELRTQNGEVFMSDGNQIVQVVPEPSAALLAALGSACFFFRRRRRASQANASGATPLAALGAVALAAFVGSVQAGPYSPGADQPGSTAIPSTSSSISGWATGVVDFQPGPVDITNPTGAKASFGTASAALGPSDATGDNPNPVVSLGDGGSITLSFGAPIYNGAGADLAVYENAFRIAGGNLYFMELAYVAVSSDGVNFFTFPSVSLTQTTTQVASFGGLDPTNIYDLAGRDIAGYGTPFDLSELAGVSPLLDVNNVQYVRLTDVVGSINPTYARYDSLGNIINDPFKTNFSSGGFDLDAVAALNQVPEPSASGLCIAGTALLGFYRPRFVAA